jgi:hypothetical protein
MGVGVVLYFRWVLLFLTMSIVLALMYFAVFKVSVEPAGVTTEIRLCRHSESDDARSGEADSKKAQLIDRGFREGSHALAQSASWVRHGRPMVRSMKKVKVKFKTKAKMPLVNANQRQEGDQAAGEPKLFPRRMAIVCIIAYLGTTVIVVWFTKTQARFYKAWCERQRSYSDCTVFASGIPRTETNPAKLRSFFEAALGGSTGARQPQKVIGVSIAYDVAQSSEQYSRFTEYTHKLQDKIDARSTRSIWSDLRIDHPLAVTDPPSNVSVDPPPKKTRPFAFLVHKLLPPSHPSPCAQNDEAWEEAAKRELRSIKGTGSAYIVLASELARDQLLQRSGMLGPNGTGPVLFKPCDTDPTAVMWEAHAQVPSLTVIITALAKLLLMIMFWALLFTPYAFYHITAQATPGSEMSPAADFVLGMLIAVGNQFVTLTIDKAVNNFGFRNRDMRDAVSMSMIYMATIMNTLHDVLIVLVALRGLSWDLAMHGTLDQSHYDRVAATELFALLVPGYLLTPYILSPIVEDIVPYFMSTRLIRSTTGVPRSSAERKFTCPKYDMPWHYSDLLLNFSVCLPLLMFETHYMYTIMVVLIVCNLLCFGVDHYRLSRACTVTPMHSSSMNTAFSYLIGLPLAVMGVIAIHWLLLARFLTPPQYMEKWYKLLFVPLHIMVHIVLIRWARRSEESRGSDKATEAEGQSKASYADITQEHWSRMCFFDYFNTNPVHVLYSWLLHDKLENPSDKFIIPYILGKEHLMLLNPQIAKKEHMKECMRRRFLAASK